MKKPLAVVTGASSGIGFELAKQFAGHGYDLLIASDEAIIRDAGKKLTKRGTSVESVQVDLATRRGVETLIRKIGRRPVDVMVLNAGVGAWGDFAREISLEEDLNVINLNILSTVHLTKAVLKGMLDRGKGRILFTSSVAASMPGPLFATYAASKAFIQSFAEAIRNEVEDSGVVVTALMPGATETQFFRRAGMTGTRIGQAKKDNPAQVAHQGFEALMRGQDHVVAGSFRNRVQAVLSRFLSDPMKAKSQRVQLEPIGKKRKAA